MARPTKRNEKTEARICAALRVGVTRKAAAGAAGIHYDTFLTWVKQFSEFSVAVACAEAQCEVRCAAILSKAAQGYNQTETCTARRIISVRRAVRDTEGALILVGGAPVLEEVLVPVTDTVTTITETFDWRAAESILKRRFKAHWGERIQQEVSGEPSAPLLMALFADQLVQIYGERAPTARHDDASSPDVSPKEGYLPGDC